MIWNLHNENKQGNNNSGATQVKGKKKELHILAFQLAS